MPRHMLAGGQTGIAELLMIDSGTPLLIRRLDLRQRSTNISFGR